MNEERRRAPRLQSSKAKRPERLLTWEGWVIAFIVTAVVCNGGAKVLILAGIIS